MKEAESIRLAELEIKNSRERLEAAKLLLKNGKIADSINRAYYAMFHVARALLFHHDIEPKIHEDVIREFSRIIGEEKIMDRKFAKNFRQVFVTRESVGYRVRVFLDQEAREAFNKAKEFIENVIEAIGKIVKEKLNLLEKR